MSCPSSTQERGVASMPPTFSLRCRRTSPAHLGGAIWGSHLVQLSFPSGRYQMSPGHDRHPAGPVTRLGDLAISKASKGRTGWWWWGGLSSVALIMQSLAKHPAAEHAGGTSPPGPRGARRRPLSAVP